MHAAQRQRYFRGTVHHGMIAKTQRAVRDGWRICGVRGSIRRARWVRDEAAAEMTMNGRHRAS